MKVFISWSGERSQALALALHEWSQLVLHYIRPWISKSDINAGERWATEVAKELEATNFGIICITRENVNSAWILFEAGALAKSMQEGRMIPLLLDIDFKDITGPLAQFQAKRVDKSGVGDIVNSINRYSSEQIPEPKLSQLFEIMWPQFEQKVAQIPKQTTPAKQNRPQQEILEELVSSIRGLDVRFRESLDDSPRRRRRSQINPMMLDEVFHRLEHGPGDPIRILLFSSFLKDDLPWLYELGLDAYRSLSGGYGSKSRNALRRFTAALRLLRHGPMMELLGSSKEIFMLVQEMEHFLPKGHEVEDFFLKSSPKMEIEVAESPSNDDGSSTGSEPKS